MYRFLKWISPAVAVVLLFQNCSESALNLPQKGPVSQDVVESLEIIRQPQSQTVTPNQSVELSVEVNDEAEVTYQWYFENQQISGAVDATLAIPNVKAGNIGQYYVVISKGGREELTSQPGVLSVTSPVAGNLSLAVGTGPQTVGDNAVVLATCPAGEAKVANLTIRNIPDGDVNEGAPGFVDFALCEKKNILSGQVNLKLDNCDAGFSSAASATYQNVSSNDFGNGDAPDNPVIQICDQSGFLEGNIALTTEASCPAGLSQINQVTFKNTGDFENGSAPLNVSILLCGR